MAEALSEEILTDCQKGLSLTYDLANFNSSWIPNLIKSVFGEEMRAKQYCSIKFIIGAGKKQRQKYNEDNLQKMTQELRELEFVEDRGASACFECQKSYKYQHDTDKDLKYLHVVPKCLISIEEEKIEKSDVVDDKGKKTTPELLCAKSTLEEFEELVEYNVPSFSQKRALLKRLKTFKIIVDECDGKLAKMEQLTEEEQEMYDTVAEIQNKIELIEKQLEEMIAEGRLTAGEQQHMVDELIGKLDELALAKSAAEAESKPKRIEQIEKLSNTVNGKIETLKSKKPIVYTIEHAEELQTLKKNVKALKALENKPGLRTPAEASKLAKLPGLEERIEQIETEDKGWYEDECATLLFGEKIQPAVSKTITKKPSGGGNPQRSSAAGGGWISKAAASSSGAGKNKSTSAAVKKKTSNPFDMLGEE